MRSIEERKKIVSQYGKFDGLNYPQLLKLQAQKYADKVLFVHHEERITFREFDEATDHLAAALKKAGLKKGQICGLLLPNGIAYLKFQIAILKLGAILLTLDTRHRAHELEFRLGFSQAEWLIMTDSFLKGDYLEIIKEIKPRLPDLKTIFVSGTRTPGDMRSVDDLLKYRADSGELAGIDLKHVKDSDAATILFTSGTTSDPKGVVMSHRARVFTGIRISERLLIADDDVLLDPLPFCHEFGGFTIISHAIVAGGTVAIMDTFNAEEALDIIVKERVSVLYGVPTMFTYMLNSPSFKEHDVKASLRTGYMSGAACPLELVKRVQDEMGCNIAVAYGSSEAPSHTISEYDDTAETKASTIGKPIRDARVRIVDEDRKEVALGTAGEISLFGKNIMNEYFRRPDLTAEAIDKDGWLYTRDLGKMDERGYIAFMGRKGDMIISGGFNVYPVEVEEVLYKLPFVASAAVIGLPDAIYGEYVLACIVLREGEEATEKDVIEYCKKQMANYKVPKKVVFMKELPLTPGTTKIKKSVLKEMYTKS